MWKIDRNRRNVETTTSLGKKIASYPCEGQKPFSPQKKETQKGRGKKKGERGKSSPAFPRSQKKNRSLRKWRIPGGLSGGGGAKTRAHRGGGKGVPTGLESRRRQGAGKRGPPPNHPLMVFPTRTLSTKGTIREEEKR